jgi:hypothetical protein
MGLKRGDRLTVVTDGEEVKLLRAEGVVARTAGAFRTGAPVLSAEELREAAERAIAEGSEERSRS